MQPAETCIFYPVERYLLVLKFLSGKASIVKFALGYNETETFLNGLEDNKMYMYSVTAINKIGNVTAHSEKVLSEFNSCWSGMSQLLSVLIKFQLLVMYRM